MVNMVLEKIFSCETALHELITEINNNRDKRLITLLLFIDFKKPLT
jgi:hypothetical protein